MSIEFYLNISAILKNITNIFHLKEEYDFTINTFSL